MNFLLIDTLLILYFFWVYSLLILLNFLFKSIDNINFLTDGWWSLIIDIWLQGRLIQFLHFTPFLFSININIFSKTFNISHLSGFTFPLYKFLFHFLLKLYLLLSHFLILNKFKNFLIRLFHKFRNESSERFILSS